MIPKKERMQEIYTIEAEYLEKHPDSGYLTEILPLSAFPDYIDYLPHGCIVRKIQVMGYLPKKTVNQFIVISKEEYSDFIRQTTAFIIARFEQLQLL